jgi:hypothetical protein
MKKMKQNKILFLIVILVAVMAACIPSPPKPGFRISTTITRFNDFFFQETFAYPNAGVNGRLVQAAPYYGTVTGTIPGFLGSTGPQAYLNVDRGVAPAFWNVGFSLGSFCGGQTMMALIFPGEDYGLDCLLIPIGGFFIVSPSTIDVESPPPFVTINGSGISSAGGMPTLEYYSSYGTLVAQCAASEVAADGSWLTASTPDMSSISGGRYLVTIRNPNGGVAGNAFVDVFRYTEPPPDPDPGPCEIHNMICPELELVY